MKRISLLFALVLFAGFTSMAQESTKKVSLLWDGSYGMLQKDLNTELSFLDSYFNRNPEVELQLTVFSNEIIQQENFNITAGNWDELRISLMNTVYDGSAAYSKIFDSNWDEIILVTDGKEVSDNIPKSFAKPVFVISSSREANRTDLKNLAISSGGAFFDLAADTDSGLEVFGDSDIPFTTVAVRSTQRDSDPGLQGNQVLDEVLLSATREDEELINTGNIKQDKRKLGYAIETISSDDIKEQDINIETAVQGQFSNIELKSDQNLSEFVSRGKNMTILGDQTGLIVIDGVPVESSVGALTGINAPSNGPGTNIDKTILTNVSAVDPANIESITVLKGLAATNKYGTLGRNGVILITTKAASFDARTSDKEIVLGTTATYSGDPLTEAALPDTTYMRVLKDSKDVNEAYNAYLQQRKTYGASPSFFIDVASYFHQWNNPGMVERILSNISELPIADTSILLAQAYKYDQYGMHSQALQVYEKILKLQPSAIQNYRNLALAYKRNGMVQKALILYDRMDKKHFDGIAASRGLQQSIDNEFKNLVALNKAKFNTSYLSEKYRTSVEFYKRVVFEWNSFDAEFDLQIINPQKRYFTWSHTKEFENARMGQEQREGYGLEEFFMTADDRGEWTFNLEYLGKMRSDNSQPTYLKVTIYSNYGKPNQRSEVKVISLDEINKKENILKVKV